MYKRIIDLKIQDQESLFFWGPRQTGKSTLLNQLYPQTPKYDLLLSHEFMRLTNKPGLLREELLASFKGGQPVIIDEIQKIPPLLDEVQWLIVNKNITFILCGSSARKLKRGGANLLGGRALSHELFPLVYPEIPNFDLTRALNHGLLPRHYLSNHPIDLLRSYVGDYLKEEVAAEALTRNIPAFSRFLEIAAFSHGEIVNFKNIACECGVSGPTAKEYFQILVDTLLARFIPSFQKRPKRRVIQSPKFYYFDVGLANFLLKRGQIVMQSENFGRAFEHFILQEILAHSHYSGLHYPVSYWRTTSGLEVDFILGDHEAAIEVKGTQQAGPHHAKGLLAFREEYSSKQSIVVSCDPRPRRMGEIWVLPWEDFLKQLWSNKIMA